jgi:hypothetical protein
MSIGHRASSKGIPALHRAVGNRAVSALLNGGTGVPLDALTQQDMEARFGHDFGDVRIHAEGTAADSAREMHAAAYTVGRDIAFAAGLYNPRSAIGRRLLAHELAHVVQQSRKDERGAPVAGLESSAEYAAQAISDGRSTVAVAGGSGPALARQDESAVATSGAVLEPLTTEKLAEPRQPPHRGEQLYDHLDSNLVSWEAHLLKHVDKAANKIVETEEEALFWRTLAADTASEFIGGVLEELADEVKPLKMLIKALFTAGHGAIQVQEHDAKKALDSMKDELQEAGEKALLSYEEEERKAGEDYIDAELKKKTAPAKIRVAIDRRWPRLTAATLHRAIQLCEQVMAKVKKLRDEEEARQKALAERRREVEAVATILGLPAERSGVLDPASPEIPAANQEARRRNQLRGKDVSISEIYTLQRR